MAQVFIPPLMREATAGVDHVEIVGTTLRQIVRALIERWPDLEPRLLAGDKLAPGLTVSIDGAFAAGGLSAKVGENCEVHFLPAIGGG